VKSSGFHGNTRDGIPLHKTARRAGIQEQIASGPDSSICSISPGSSFAGRFTGSILDMQPTDSASAARVPVAETMADRIIGYRLSLATGHLSDRRVIAEVPSPDNIELDAAGKLWVASPIANALLVVDPETGEWSRAFHPPASHAWNCSARTCGRRSRDC
jgi:streptogramin lyase